MIKKNANASGGKAKRSLDILRECILVNDISAMARTYFSADVGVPPGTTYLHLDTHVNIVYNIWHIAAYMALSAAAGH
jgi:hypothetical protein